MKEKIIKGFPDYSITNTGRVFSTKGKEKRELKTARSPEGYLKVGLSLNGKGTTISVHKLVATHFIPNRKNYDIINHKNGNKSDNNVKNLEWTTRSGNAQHYEKNIAPKYRQNKKMNEESDLKAKIAIIGFAAKQLKNNPKQFLTLCESFELQYQ